MKTLVRFILFAAALAATDTFAATYTVTVTNENGPGSLRQAMLDANANPGPDLIRFDIASSGKTIIPTNALPPITEPVALDGTTQPGYSNAPLVEINGQSAGTGTDGLRLWAGSTTIRGLVINRFNGDGIEIATNGNNVIEGCWIGLGTDGTTRRANSRQGIFITNSPHNIIGGLNATQRNLITGNTQNGVLIEGTNAFGTVVQGNWVGLNVNSATGAGNSQSGVHLLNAPSNTIGGPVAGAVNLISGNSQNGLRIEGTNALANLVLGNFIGLDLTGTTNRANGNNGVYLFNAASNTIGGATAAARNVIAGNNQVGVRLEGATTRGNRVLGNLIGTDVSGTLARGNGGEGVSVLGNAFANTIGGTNAGEANLIAHNGSDGIYFQNGTNNSARANSIHSNTGLGIDLGNNGVQANDAGDADTGANNLQNFPILSAATNTPAGLFVAGTLNSRPGASYALDFYSNVARDPSTNGEGQVWLGSLAVNTGTDSNAAFTITFPAGASGRFISATATDTNGNTSEFSPCVRAESTLAPLTFTVTNTNNSGPGSLRQAILDNNLAVRSNRNTIVFAISEAGPHTIAPLSPLPTLTESVALDGFTQSGSLSNSLPAGNNAVWNIVLDGAATPAAGTDGLRVEADHCLIQGLAITRFADNGIELATNANGTVRGCLVGLGLDGSDQGNANSGLYLNNSAGNLIGGPTPAARNIISGQNSFYGIGLAGAGASNNVIQGNFIGTGLDGAGDLGNNSDGININGAPNNLIGGATAGAGNVIAGNNSDGVEINGSGASGNQVLGNLIGLDATGTGALGNSQHGVLLTSNSRSNFIGGALAGEGNRIAYNLNGDGISLATGTNNTFRANAIFANGELGIDLGNNGKTANDAGDPDSGANLLQNFPLVTDAALNVGGTFIAGTLNSKPATSYALDFFSSIVCDPGTNGEGQVYLGSTTVTTGTDSNATFSLTLPVTAVGRFLTATATDPLGNTSEFGPCFRAASFLPPATFTVVNTNDAGPGSLRQAVLDNNVTYFGSPNTIAFAIPGAGLQTIAPASALPDITEPVLIDGFTQTNATPNTLPDGNNAVLQIRLWGRSFTDGLRLRASGCTVRGLAIVNWGGDGIDIYDCKNSVVAGCLLGLNPNGTAQFNGNSGINIYDSGGNRIGGTAPADRNALIGLVLGNGASNNVVQGNFIGCGLRGTNTVGFPSFGIVIGNGTDNLIGGTAPGARNIISGHSGNAVVIGGDSPARNVIVGNFIGPDVTGLRRLGNGRGIHMDGGSRSNRVGGVTVAERNVISGNGSDGVAVIAPAFGNAILGNWIGVDATGSGVLTNSGVGVFLSGHNNRVGGILAGEANLIANNTGGGLLVHGGGNAIRGNSIFNSVVQFVGATALGINLGFDNVTPNDAGDADTGANNLQNFPVLTAATGSVSTVQIVGTLNSQPGTSYALDFYSSPTCDPSGHGEGQTYLGSTTALTDGSGNANFNVAFPRPLAGRYVSATATDPSGNTSEFAACLAAVSTVPGSTFSVTTTNDSGPGSLRQAILDANNVVSAGNTIAFSIPGSSVRVIRPLTPLPAFIEPVTIDGFTQTNASANTLPNGNNANWLIGLRGVGASFNEATLRLNVAGLVIRGLHIFGSAGLGVEIASSNCVVAGCFLSSNGAGGIKITSAHRNRIGGVMPAERNVISGHDGSRAIEIYAGNGNTILGNFLGPDPAGGSALGSQFDGVSIFNGSDNMIGDGTAGGGNVIAFHQSDAVSIQSGTNNSVRGNRIFSNSFPIDLGSDGVSANDIGDGDTGANQLQNFPVITNATASVGSTQIRGTLNSAASTAFGLDFFSSIACHGSGHGQGEFYLGSASVTTDGSGNASFNVTLPVGLQGNVLSATATDPFGNTSEFSACFAPTIALPGFTYTVTNTANSGPGSLRQALLDSASTANSTPDQIRFNIPGGGVKVISLLTPLPEPEDTVFIDGFTQPGASANTSTNADNAVLRVQLDGSAIGFGAYGLNFTNGGNTVRGLSFTGFGIAGLALNSASNVVEGCWIGLAPSGLPGSNTGSGLAVYGPANRIGGIMPAARNIIAGHEDYGLVIVSSPASNNVVQGTFIGVGPSGTNLIGNGRDGVVIGQARNNLIGGTNAGAANSVGGSGRHGIRIEGATATGNRIEGNSIGASFDFEVGLTNRDGGVLITSGASSNTIGGWAEETANVIAYNGGPGVWVLSGTQNGVIGNDIGYNSGKDILVSPGANDGVQPPVLDWAVLGSTRVAGQFIGQPNTTYYITVMAEQRVKKKIRKQWVDTFTITTDGFGNANFDETLPSSLPRNTTGRVFANATCINSSSENSDGVPLIGAGEVDLVLDAQMAQDPVPRGSNAVVLISVANNSPTPCSSAVVVCTRPPGCNLVGATNPHGPTTVVGDQVRCELGAISAGASKNLAVVFQPTLPGGGLFQAPTEVHSVLESEGFPPDNFLAPEFFVLPPPTNADVAVTIELHGGPIVHGEPHTVNVTVRNFGSSAAHGVSVSVPMPQSTAYISASTDTGTASFSPATRVVDWQIPSLAPGQSVTLTLQLNTQVDAVRGEPHLLTATAFAVSPPDPDSANNFDFNALEVGPPRLDFSFVNGQFNVLFPVTAAPFELMSTTSLLPPIDWSLIPPSLIITAGQLRVFSIAPATNPFGAGFYTLILPPPTNAEPRLEVSQLSLNLDNFPYTFSEWGAADLTFKGEPGLRYFNLNLDDEWVIQNIPVTSQKGTNVWQTVRMNFPLTLNYGLPKGFADIGYGYTTNTLPVATNPPPEIFGIMTTNVAVPLYPTKLASGIAGEPLTYHAPTRLVGGQSVSNAVAKPTFPNRPQGENECTPASVLNSLEYLNQSFSLNLSTQLLNMATIKEAVGWTPNGAPSKRPWFDSWVEYKVDYMAANNIAIETAETTDPKVAMDALAKGHDVEVDVKGHTACVVSVTDIGDGDYAITLSHDVFQGADDIGQITEIVIFDSSSGTFYGNIYGTAWTTSFTRFVIERPKP